ncbi:cytochrome P450 [Phanerochaete sordida]|uniref:Cytochrome P450 n=1 Tax=Phanerochaete sordida TaxID=48140 RepID=A0A9P3GKX6_9APHY|nr:cytochrome P450 [Phanerochaete sordida]
MQTARSLYQESSPLNTSLVFPESPPKPTVMSADNIGWLLVSWLLAGVAAAWVLATRFTKRPHYPPSPDGWPIIGNLLDVPRDNPWLRYAEVGKELGSDIIHFEMLGRHIVVLNTIKVARDLFDKRSDNYSGRPESVMISELSGWHRNWGFWQYGDAWKEHRKAFVRHFRPETITDYYQNQTKSVRSVLQALLDSPEAFQEHIQLMTGTLILNAVYGLEVDRDDTVLDMAERAVSTLHEVADGHVYMADIVPAIKYLPSWVPGTGYRRQANKWKLLVDRMYAEPYDMFQMAPSGRSCLASSLTSSLGDASTQQTEELVISVTGTTYGAGTGTTVAAISGFTLAIALFPETQTAVQQELDRVLGRGRLPEIEDQPALPQVMAMVYEVLRWTCVAPIGVAHATVSDDMYAGYFIPGGTIVFANIWAMLHDPSAFPDPARFDPTRFLADDGTLRSDAAARVSAVFGFGRRVCPGRHFVRDVLWLVVASVLAVFAVEPVRDEHGRGPSAEFTARFQRAPVPFQCQFVPRFPGAESLIRWATGRE